MSSPTGIQLALCSTQYRFLGNAWKGLFKQGVQRHCNPFDQQSVVSPAPAKTFQEDC